MAKGVKNIGKKLLSPFTVHRSPLTFHPSPLTNKKEDFWALKDVSFEVKQGDRVGIIGRNGAGKSTLLKILSRITEPTSGRIEITGRVASLLEVGTGFHPELTGRENIFLNGAILGMGKAEIKQKFDEIVAFAEIEKFLDTPVKRYSSGMYVRLAFAVAAHLEPEILVVDEVLAVGDAQFQKKCLGKMEDVAKKGRTVLFVSHNMNAIEALCETVILLQAGRLISQGNVFEQITSYTQSINELCDAQLKSKVVLGDGIKLTKFEINPNPVESGKPAGFVLEINAFHPLMVDSLVILFYSIIGGRVAVVDLRQAESGYLIEGESSLELRGIIKSIPFVEGEYSVGIFFASVKATGNYLNLINMTVLPRKTVDSVIPYPANVRGFVNLDHTMTVDSV